MIKFFIIICISLVVFNTCYAQNERVYLQLDKYSCRNGDTIWFKGYIFNGPFLSALSTNIYVELFNDRGESIVAHIFPIMQGLSTGQLIIPDSLISNNYFVRAFTRYQLNFDSTHLFTVPITVHNSEQPKFITGKKLITISGTRTSRIINDIYWATTVDKDPISSLVQTTNNSRKRNLSLTKNMNADSSYRANFVLTDSIHPKRAQFPRDNTKVFETLDLYEDNHLIGRQFLSGNTNDTTITITADSINTKPYASNSWQIKFPDTTTYAFSVSVTDADKTSSPPISILYLEKPFTEKMGINIEQVDSSYISFTGIGTKKSGKKDGLSRDLLMAGTQDSTFLFTKLVLMDSTGRFVIDSLFFFDSIDLRYQISKTKKEATNDIQLEISRFISPKAHSSIFRSMWLDDPASIPADSLYSWDAIENAGRPKSKILTPVIITGTKNLRKELDNRYTAGPFSQPAADAYDLRNYTSKYNRDIFQYINAQGGRLKYDIPSNSLFDSYGRPIRYFVDEQEIDPQRVGSIDFERIAYIKVLESDFLSTRPSVYNLQTSGGSTSDPIHRRVKLLNLCIYMKKGADFRNMPSDLNKIPVRGYSSMIDFNPGLITLFWAPFEFGNQFNIQFQNSETAKKFRLVIDGINDKGHVIHLEKILR